jgi:uncharacterized membrane protein YdcZ (DUF606 family)
MRRFGGREPGCGHMPAAFGGSWLIESGTDRSDEALSSVPEWIRTGAAIGSAFVTGAILTRH